MAGKKSITNMVIKGRLQQLSIKNRDGSRPAPKQNFNRQQFQNQFVRLTAKSGIYHSPDASCRAADYTPISRQSINSLQPPAHGTDSVHFH